MRFDSGSVDPYAERAFHTDSTQINPEIGVPALRTRLALALALPLLTLGCPSQDDDTGTTDDSATLDDTGADDTGDTGTQTPARIFFAESDLACTTNSLKYLDFGDTEATDIVPLGGPDSVRDIAVGDDGWVYFTLSGSSADNDDTVEKVRDDGTGLQSLATYATGDLDPALDPVGITVDPDNSALYWWATSGCSPCGTCGGPCSQIMESNLTGAAPSTVYTIPDTGYRNVDSLELNRSEQRLYFSDIQNDPHLAAVDTDGSNFQGLVTRSDGGIGEVEVDETAGKVYWLDSEGIGDSTAIKRANLDGSGQETLLMVGGSQANTPRGLALDTERGHLYWTESPFCGDSTAGRIRRAELDGSNPETVLDDLGLLLTVEIKK